MISQESKEWIAAGVRLANEPAAIVLCPHCHNNHLKVQNIFEQSIKVEAKLYCDNCGAYNYLTYSVGTTNSSSADSR